MKTPRQSSALVSLKQSLNRVHVISVMLKCISRFAHGSLFYFRYLEKAIANSCYEEGTCNTFGLPLTYNAYHLNGKTINMDGRLDDEAWAEVPWTETFVGKPISRLLFFFVFVLVM